MKVYLSASYIHLPRVEVLAKEITKYVPGVEIVSTWHTQGNEEEELARMGHQHFIDRDIDDMEKCQVFVFLNHPHYARLDSPGKWVELGYMLRTIKPIIVMGDMSKNCLFLHDKRILRVEQEHHLFDLLKTLAHMYGHYIKEQR